MTTLRSGDPLLDLFRSLSTAGTALERLDSASLPGERVNLAAIRRALEVAASECLALQRRRGAPEETP